MLINLESVYATVANLVRGACNHQSALAVWQEGLELLEVLAH
jgi:hypothetical protein